MSDVEITETQVFDDLLVEGWMGSYYAGVLVTPDIPDDFLPAIRRDIREAVLSKVCGKNIDLLRFKLER